jgi:hypothetical protein
MGELLFPVLQALPTAYDFASLVQFEEGIYVDMGTKSSAVRNHKVTKFYLHSPHMAPKERLLASKMPEIMGQITRKIAESFEKRRRLFSLDYKGKRRI